MAYEHFAEIGFGVLLGALLTFIATHLQNKITKQEERTSKLRALLAEMKDNKASVDVGVMLGNAKQRLAYGMWEEGRSEIFQLPDDLCEKLRQVYHKIAQYNGIVEYDLAIVTGMGVGQGTFSTLLDLKVGEIKASLVSAILELDDYLKKRAQ